MGWAGWAVSGAAIAMGTLIVAGVAIAAARGLRLRRRIRETSRRVGPLTESINAGARDIETGVARAEAGAGELSRELEELRVSLAELQVIGRHAARAFGEIRGPLGWIAGIRALVKYRGR